MFFNKRFLLGASITTSLITLLVMQVGFGKLVNALAGANYIYVIPGIVVYFASIYLRSYRWRYLLYPFAKTETIRLYPVVSVGYAANNLLPLRIGELARSYYLAKREPIRASTGLATILTERIFDGLTLLLVVALVAIFIPLNGFVVNLSMEMQIPTWFLITSATLPFIFAFSLVIASSLLPESLNRIISTLATLLPSRAEKSIKGISLRFLQGFIGLHRPSRLVAIFALSIPVWLTEAVVYFIIAMGFGLNEQFDTVLFMVAGLLLVTSISNLATSVPSSPGSVGAFELLATVTLVFLGIKPDIAAAYAIVLHLTLLIPITCFGLLMILREGLTLGQLTKNNN